MQYVNTRQPLGLRCYELRAASKTRRVNTWIDSAARRKFSDFFNVHMQHSSFKWNYKDASVSVLWLKNVRLNQHHRPQTIEFRKTKAETTLQPSSNFLISVEEIFDRYITLATCNSVSSGELFSTSGRILAPSKRRVPLTQRHTAGRICNITISLR